MLTLRAGRHLISQTGRVKPRPMRHRDLMFPLRPLPVVLEPTEERGAMEIAHRLSGAWRRVFNLSVMGFLGLAISVGLWGYNYKLSLYHPHSGTTSRVQVAKLWVEQWNVARAAASGAGNKAHRVSASLLLLPCKLQRDLSRGADVRIILATHLRRDVRFGALIPLRSPPSNSFSA